MNTRLIRQNGAMIPGGYPFMDPRTGMKFDGFDAGGFSDQVNRIIRHRTANPRIYPPTDGKWLNFEEVTIELELYQCMRLGYDKRYCSDPAVSEEVAAAASHQSGVCRFCGGTLKERLCPTCSGHKVIGYTCIKCGSTL